MARIQDIVLLKFDTRKLSDSFLETWDNDMDTLDDEFRDHIPVEILTPHFVVALCNELGLGENSRKHEITHIESIF